LVVAYVLVLIILGPEYLGRKFDVEHDDDMDEVAGHDTITRALHHDRPARVGHSESDQDDIGEKGTVRHDAAV
jgi:SHS family lactate transporter-like MFS transporter